MFHINCGVSEGPFSRVEAHICTHNMCYKILVGDHVYFCLGDRLTDERVQVAQQAMANAETSLERLEGFISKIEDFHGSMNFLEVCTERQELVSSCLSLIVMIAQ